MGAQNTLETYTQTASDAASHPAKQIKLKAKYRGQGSPKGTKLKAGGNSGKAGRRWRRYMRGHGGGQPTAEQKTASLQQSKTYQNWRANWANGAPQPG